MSKKKIKPLKLFNGRAWCCVNHRDPRWKGIRPDSCHAYVAAYSRADARRVIFEYAGNMPSDGELRDCWHADCWGNSMDGVEPKRGLWISFGRFERPVFVSDFSNRNNS